MRVHSMTAGNTGVKVRPNTTTMVVPLWVRVDVTVKAPDIQEALRKVGELEVEELYLNKKGQNLHYTVAEATIDPPFKEQL